MEEQNLSKPVKLIETTLGTIMSLIIIVYSTGLIRFDLMILNIMLLTLVILLGYLPKTFFKKMRKIKYQ